MTPDHWQLLSALLVATAPVLLALSAVVKLL
jgi:hypothetical protein